MEARRALCMGIAMMTAAQMSLASVIVDGYFRLGEDDPGAAAGQAGKNPTRDTSGTMGLAIGAGVPTNSSSVATTAKLLTSSTLSMQFDGTSYYVTNSALNTNADNYGIEAWFCPSVTNVSQLVAYHGGSVNGYGIWLLSDGTIGIIFNGAGSWVLAPGVSITTGTWCSVAYVENGGNGYMFINGVQYAFGPHSTVAPSESFTIGSYYAGNNKFSGLVDEVRVFHFNPGEFQYSDLLFCGAAEKAVSPYDTLILASDPLAFYPMNEQYLGLGNVMFDIATNAGAQNATYSSVSGIQNGPQSPAFQGMAAFNTAPVFNGASSKSAVTNMPGLGTNYTIEGWIYNTASRSLGELAGYFWGRGDASVYDCLGIIGVAPGQGRLLAYNGDGSSLLYGTTVFNTNTWQYAAFVRSGGTVAVYLNGKVDCSGPFPAMFTNSGFTFGVRPDDEWHFLGSLDEIAVYPRALTASEIFQHYDYAVAESNRRPVYVATVLADNPVGYWRMNESWGPWLADLVGTNDGLYRKQYTTNAAALSVISGPVPALYKGFETNNTAPYFNGAGDNPWNVNTDNVLLNPSLTGTSYTVEFWFNNSRDNSALTITGYLFARGTASQFDTLGLGGNGIGLPGQLYLFNGADILYGVTSNTVGTWHHVAVVRSGNAATVYLDGKTEISGTLAANYNGNALTFGVRSDGAWTYQGYLDEIAVYDKALTADQVKAHYKAALNPPRGLVLLFH